MASLPPVIGRRFLSSSSSSSTTTTTTNVSKKWALKEVTKSNFSESLKEFKDHLSSSDFVAVSLQKTGSYRAPWHRLSPSTPPTLRISRPSTPLSASSSSSSPPALSLSEPPSLLLTHPYNFVLFPRDELKMGMPTYSFSVQTSHLTSTAEEGFDFNACIYNGISYLSRAQESAAKALIGNPTTSSYVMNSSSTHTVADTVLFKELNRELSIGKVHVKTQRKMMLC